MFSKNFKNEHWNFMVDTHAYCTHFIIDDFTHERESAATQWVKHKINDPINLIYQIMCVIRGTISVQ